LALRQLPHVIRHGGDGFAERSRQFLRRTFGLPVLCLVETSRGLQGGHQISRRFGQGFEARHKHVRTLLEPRPHRLICGRRHLASTPTRNLMLLQLAALPDNSLEELGKARLLSAAAGRNAVLAEIL